MGVTANHSPKSRVAGAPDKQTADSLSWLPMGRKNGDSFSDTPVGREWQYSAQRLGCMNGVPASLPARRTLVERLRADQAPDRNALDQGRPCFSFRQPPARLLAMIWRNIAKRAGRLICSPSWIEI